MINAETSEERLLKLIRSKDCSYLPGVRRTDHPSAKSKDSRVVKPETPARNRARILWASLCLLFVGLGISGYLSGTFQFAPGVAGTGPNRVLPAPPPPAPRVIAAAPLPAPDSALTLSYQIGFPEYHQEWNELPETGLFEGRKGEGQPQRPKVSTLTSVSDQFRILGLAIGANSNAILEDRKTKQIYTVTVGQRIGEVLVKDIRADSVLVQVGENIFELMP